MWLGVLAGTAAGVPQYLVHLDLSENQIGPDGSESLAGILTMCVSLTHLNLSRQIGPARAESLAPSTKKK